ncbi:MAG: transposase, partial [Bacteroidetes bacterium]|nr:transposase [Bacteroidota bacterium]
YSIAELCRKHGISQATFYKWNKEFMEAGKKRLSGDTTREATSGEVAELRRLNKELKELVADLLLDNNILKKSIDRLADSVKSSLGVVSVSFPFLYISMFNLIHDIKRFSSANGRFI